MTAPHSADDAWRTADGRIAQGWKTSIGSMLGLLLGASTLTQMTYGTFVPYLAGAFGWSVGVLSNGGAILAVMVMIIAPLQGLLIDRFGARPLILWSIPVFGLGFAAMSLQTGAVWLWYLAWVLLPMLGLGIWPGAWVRASASWFTRRLGLAMGVVNVGVGIAAAMLPLVVGAIADTYGWRAAYAGLGLAAVAITWPVAFAWVREPDRAAALGRSRAAGDGDTVAEARAQPVFWALLAAFSLLGFVSGAVLINHVNVLVERGIPRETAIMLQSFLGLAMIIARILAGWLLDRVRVTIVMPIFAAGAAVALALYAGGATGMLAILCAILLGLMVGAEFDVLGYAIRRYHGRRAFGTLYGLVFAVFQLGSAIGIAAIGVLHGQSGDYGSGLVVTGSVAALAAVILTRFGAYRHD